MNLFRVCLALAGLSFSSSGAFVLAAQAVVPASSHPGSGVFVNDSTAAPGKEDWSSVAVDRSALLPISSALIGKTELPLFTREVFRVQWRAGDPIDLFVIRPHDIEKPSAVLYLYGYPNDTNRFWDDGWCERATRGGLAAVGFVSALTGQRYANRPMKEWFVSELREALGTTTHDVQMILNYLTQRDDLATSQFGMFGQGSGGTVALLAAAADPRIAFVDVLDPWGDWPDWFRTSPEVPEDERAAYQTSAFLSGIRDLDPVNYLPGLKPKGLRIQQVLDEPITPPASKKALRAAGQTSGLMTEYKSERERLNVYRISGLNGWMQEQFHTPVNCGSSPKRKQEAGEALASDSVPRCTAVEALHR